jgi:hypothetical protein
MEHPKFRALSARRESPRCQFHDANRGSVKIAPPAVRVFVRACPLSALFFIEKRQDMEWLSICMTVVGA